MAKAYPHVEQISDWNAKQTIRLLWDEIHALQAQAETLQGDVRAAQTSLTTFGTRLTTAEQTAEQASLAIATVDPVTGAASGGGQVSNPTGSATAPIMLPTLMTVYAAQPWDLDEGDAFDQTNPLGRGGFTEAAVTALHGLDARWGHIQKNAPHTRYNGHAIDACMWKRPDGTIGEIYDIISTVPHWLFVSASAANLALWYY